MLYGKYSFHSEFNGEAILPPYKGSTFRGTFGHSLKRITCALQFQQCQTCLLKERCIYSRIFETSASDSNIQTPHPFIIEPSSDEKTNYSEGGAFCFDIILIGWANDYLPYFIYAVQEMGRTGIGKKIDGKRSGFVLKKVTDPSGTLFSATEGQIIKAKPSELDIPMADDADTTWDQITIKLITPLRLKFRNKLNLDLPFHVLVRSMLRRVSLLNIAYGAGDPPLDYRGLVAGAQNVRSLSEDLKWFDWRRYSNRQEQAMLMGGISGSVTYQGEIKTFLPLIKYCEKVHIGKATSFGLGKIELQID